MTARTPDAGTPDHGPHRADLRNIARRTMLERGFEPDFPAPALAELQHIAGPAGDAGPQARDLRALLWCSIDNDDSRDLDQLSVAEALDGGRVRLLIAVADVDSLVAKGSALDAHAQRNTTSVYTPGAIFPMLPERLSTDLTSLNQDQDRSALVVELVEDGAGTVASSDIYRARVRNRAKLAYDSVAAWLEGPGPAPAPLAAVPGLDENLRLQDRAAQRLRELRHRRGALDLQTIEAQAVFVDDLLTDLRPQEKNRAKELIEDFMIAANLATAEFLGGHGFASLRRVLRSPDRWPRIVELAANLHEELPAEPDAAALAGFLDRRRRADPLRFPDLSLSIIKLMGNGEYVVEQPGGEAPGHFGLAVHDYTHSTAPNRRYPDLITQRLLKAALARQATPYTGDELTALALHCTAKEDDANKVERQVRKSAAAMLLAGHEGERFDGVVTGANEHGTWVRVLRPPVEGKVEQGAAGLDVGDRVRVRLIRTDVERGFIDFAKVT